MGGGTQQTWISLRESAHGKGEGKRVTRLKTSMAKRGKRC